MKTLKQLKAKSERAWKRKHPEIAWPGYKKYKFSVEHREKLSKSHLGKKLGPIPEETRAKQRKTIRDGVSDGECPSIAPGSRTEQVIIGSLLGDGSINPGGRFRETHGPKQKEIVFVAARLLEPFFILKKEDFPRTHTRLSPYQKDEEIKTYQHYIRLPQLPVFKKLRNLWYPRGKKIVPEEILSKIGLQAIAWWYIGDGYYRGTHVITFCSECFTKEDNIRLTNQLIKLGFESAKITARNRIRLSIKDTKKILPLIAEYTPSCVRYKLGPLEATYKTYNPKHYDPEQVFTGENNALS
jgi:hypothetical protein